MTKLMSRPTSDVAFTETVKAEQARRGSRAQYTRVEQRGGWPNTVTPELAQFLKGARSFYLATASKDGQPYIQHRGGPAGFLTAVDERTLGFADYGGNKQYITLGNLAENPRAFIFLMDYANRRRIKIWGSARVVEGDDALIGALSKVTSGSPERAILFTIEAWDRNCPQHIPRLLAIEDVEAAVGELQRRIATLEAENARLKSG